jgi:predicted transcriptional regulator
LEIGTKRYKIEIVYSGYNKINQQVYLKRKKIMYSLKCDYYKKEFNYLHELIDDVLMSGMDPNYEITKNGKQIGEYLNELIGY